MANTYCDYYNSVGATGYATYHGCVTETPVDPAIIGGTCSIAPTTTGKSSRIDQGATWWCDYAWMVGDTAIDLDGYEVTASFYYPDGSLFTRIENAPENESLFRLRLTDEITDTIEFGGADCIELTVDIDLERVGTPDMITGYIPGDVVRVCAGTIVAYRRGAGASGAIELEPIPSHGTLTRYTDRLFLNAMYGKQNIDEWADLENCEGSARQDEIINQRIGLEIDRVTAFIDDSLRPWYCGPFPCPPPPTIEAIATALVGHNLRDARFMNETDTVVLRKYETAMNKLNQLKEGSIRVPGFQAKTFPSFEQA